MDPIFPQPERTAPLSLPALFPASTLPVSAAPVSSPPAIRQRDRIDRIAALSQQDTAAGLLWLAMNFPTVCDAMLDKIEFDAIDDEYPSDQSDPFCAECGAAIYLSAEGHLRVDRDAQASLRMVVEEARRGLAQILPER